MNFKKTKSLARGLCTTFATLFTLSLVGATVAKSDLCIGWVDGLTKTERNIYDEWDEDVPGYTIPGSFGGYSYKKGVAYTKDHADIQSYARALKDHAVKQGEEGFALLKNDNGALPLKNSAAGKKVALFGWNCYNMPASHTGVVAGNVTGIVSSGWGAPQEKVAYLPCTTLYDAFTEMSEVTVNSTVTKAQFTGAMKGPGGGGFGGGDPAWTSLNYEIPEKAPTDADVGTWNITKNDTTAIVAVGRGGGEGANYRDDSATGANDPMALSENELKIIKLAKEKCAKVVVLVISANSMELGPIVKKGGEYEVDAIGFCGIPNDYQYTGIAHALYGKVNATGGLTDTYVFDNSFNPATINMGVQQYSDLDTINKANDPLNRGCTSYNADNYIVEAEGIYVGYKYYETRYFDSIVNTGSNAISTKGSTEKGKAWNYANEVIFPFGHGLSYIPYTQTIKEVYVDVKEQGKVTAQVEIKNEGTEDGKFTAQLYVSRPYTELNKEHKVEKAAIDFLNSAKVTVKAGKTETVKISVPTRYLASWDSKALNGDGTYVLDAGDYYFTAAPGAHAAVNNVIEALGKESDRKTTKSATIKWNLDKLDDSTFATSNGVEVRNKMQNADINYFYGEEKVKYLSRSNWDATFPKNYTLEANDSGIQPEAKFTIKGAAKEAEWVKELISAQYKVTPSTDSSKWYSYEGKKPTGLADGQSVWQWIMSFANSNPEAFSNIHSTQWQAVKDAIDLDESFFSIKQSGGSSRMFPSIGNPDSTQSESVAGYQQGIKIDNKDFSLNVCSNTLLGSSFNPELAYEWGVLEGEGGLWLQQINNKNAYTVWGAGLNQHRTAYNGRNSEYMSEDPMLTNRIGEAQFRGLRTKGAICGPKHMGFNDQEYGRRGIACYMTEQKVRECDTRCYEGALRCDEGQGNGVMMSFARIGATNVTNSEGYIRGIMRGEWGFNGIITTDMGAGKQYHEIAALNMATVNEYAGFGGGAKYSEKQDDTAVIDGTFNYFTFGDARKDPVYAERSRETSLYLLYTLAHSSSGSYVERVENTGQDIYVEPTTVHHRDPIGVIKHAGWEVTVTVFQVVFGLFTAAAAAAWVAGVASKKED